MIYVIGTGPGNTSLISIAAQQVIAKADVLVGWPRLLTMFADHEGEKVEMSGNIDATLVYLEANSSRCVVVLASGDPMLFGIGKRICEYFPPQQRVIMPGISSVQWLFAVIGLDMNDVYITSSHGKLPNFDFLFTHPKVALVTDQYVGPYQIAQHALERNINCILIIGENLGYPSQRISVVKPQEVEQHYQMNVVVVLNEGL